MLRENRWADLDRKAPLLARDVLKRLSRFSFPVDSECLVSVLAADQIRETFFKRMQFDDLVTFAGESKKAILRICLNGRSYSDIWCNFLDISFELRPGFLCSKKRARRTKISLVFTKDGSLFMLAKG